MKGALVERIVSSTKVSCVNGETLPLDAITSIFHRIPSQSPISKLPEPQIEDGLESVWRAYRRRKGGGDPSMRLSKKQLAILPPADSTIIRSCYKRDEHMVTSERVAEVLLGEMGGGGVRRQKELYIIKKPLSHFTPFRSVSLLADDRSGFLTAANMLHNDAKTGGRFKRVPCFPITPLNDVRLDVERSDGLITPSQATKTERALYPRSSVQDTLPP